MHFHKVRCKLEQQTLEDLEDRCKPSVGTDGSNLRENPYGREGSATRGAMW